MEGIELVRAFAERREDILYAILNGSRANPRLVPDRWADYDVILGCEDYRRYVEDRGWIGEFGKLLILQQNEMSEGELRWPAFLMQFEEGLRVDLQFYTGDGAAKYRSDSLSRILLDKRGLLGEAFEPSDASYLVRPPDPEEYRRELNEFWWCAIYVGKGLARGEPTYARFMLESVVRRCFLELVSWRVGSRRGWSVDVGKHGKFLRRYADPGLWSEIESTYRTDTPAESWDSLLRACALVERIDAELRASLGFPAETERSRDIILFLERMRESASQDPRGAPPGPPPSP